MRTPRLLAALARIFALSLFLVSSVAADVAAQHRQAPTVGSPAIRFHAGSSALGIPFRYELSHLILSVRVQDALVVDMILDSGLGINGAILLDPAFGDSLGLTYAGQAQLGGGGVSDPPVANLTTGATLALPGATFSGQQLLIVTDAGPFRGYPAAGIIGKSIFDCVVELDYETSTMHLHDGELFRPPAGMVEFPLAFSYGIPVIDAAVTVTGGDQVPVKLLVDTGAVELLLFPFGQTAIRTPGYVIAAQERVLGKGMNGLVLGSTGRIAALKLGPFALEQVVTAFPDSSAWGQAAILGQNGMLGNEALRRFRVVFDYRGQRLFLNPSERFHEPFEADMSGWIGEPTPEGDVSILDIIPDSPAAQAGLVKGDVLLAVDGKAVREMGWVALERTLRQDGRKIRVTVARGSQRFDKDLMLRRLI